MALPTITAIIDVVVQLSQALACKSAQLIGAIAAVNILICLKSWVTPLLVVVIVLLVVIHISQKQIWCQLLGTVTQPTAIFQLS